MLELASIAIDTNAYQLGVEERQSRFGEKCHPRGRGGVVLCTNVAKTDRVQSKPINVGGIGSATPIRLKLRAR